VESTLIAAPGLAGNLQPLGVSRKENAREPPFWMEFERLISEGENKMWSIHTK
jgi:hypothetical protein